MNRSSIENYELVIDPHHMVLTFDLNDWILQKEFLNNQIPDPHHAQFKGSKLSVFLGPVHQLNFVDFPKDIKVKLNPEMTLLICGLNDQGMQMANEVPMFFT